jgi:uncharacterized protein YkwD
MSRKILFLTIYLIIWIVFIAGCISQIVDSSYSMRFFINETAEPIDGSVFNNDDLLGYTSNGSFNTSIENLRPGLITLNGTYQDQPFEFYFEFPREKLSYNGIDFSVSTDALKSVLFDASSLDTLKLEREIFDLVNNERQAAGIKTLKWNDKIGAVAKDYSRTLSIEGFHHKDMEGKNAGDRLKQNKIFYIVTAENLFMMTVTRDTENISKTVVNGWLDSPGHRSPIMDRDELFSDGAVGMYCEKKECYAVMVFSGLERHQDLELAPNYMTFIYLYDPTYPFDFDVPVSVEITSTEDINIYYVPGREQYENIIHHSSYQAILEMKGIKKFKREVVARKHQGIVLEKPNGGAAAKIKIDIRYS